MVVPGGGVVSYERGTPVVGDPQEQRDWEPQGENGTVQYRFLTASGFHT